MHSHLQQSAGTTRLLPQTTALQEEEVVSSTCLTTPLSLQLCSFAGLKELLGPLGTEEAEQVLMAFLECWRIRQGWMH